MRLIRLPPPPSDSGGVLTSISSSVFFGFFRESGDSGPRLSHRSISVEHMAAVFMLSDRVDEVGSALTLVDVLMCPGFVGAVFWNRSCFYEGVVRMPRHYAHSETAPNSTSTTERTASVSPMLQAQSRPSKTCIHNSICHDAARERRSSKTNRPIDRPPMLVDDALFAM
jgi:hypothetical protein